MHCQASRQPGGPGVILGGWAALKMITWLAESLSGQAGGFL